MPLNWLEGAIAPGALGHARLGWMDTRFSLDAYAAVWSVGPVATLGVETELHVLGYWKALTRQGLIRRPVLCKL
jgi:hypothetical protein